MEKKLTHDKAKRAAALALTNCDSVVQWGYRKRSWQYMDFVQKFSTYSLATLERVIEAANSASGADLYALLVHPNRTETLVNDWCALQPLTLEKGLVMFEVINLLRAAETYGAIAPQQETDISEKRRAQLLAVCRVGEQLHGAAMKTSNKFVPILRDAALVKLIIKGDDPERAALSVIEVGATSESQARAVLERLCAVAQQRA